jgi:pyruvate dehydrogenase (quinone)
MKKNAAQVLMEVLESAGVKHIYGVVGDTLNYVTDALSKSSIEWIHTRHEEVGAFAATAESYMTGNLAGCAGSCGPGTLHLINGVYEAHRARIPLIVIASQIDTMTLGMDMPQEVDYQKVFSDCSVFCEQVYNAEQARHVAVLACQAAISKQGPAVIILSSLWCQADSDLFKTGWSCSGSRSDGAHLGWSWPTGARQKDTQALSQSKSTTACSNWAQ